MIAIYPSAVDVLSKEQSITTAYDKHIHNMSVLHFVFTNPAISEYSASRNTIKDHFRARASNKPTHQPLAKGRKRSRLSDSPRLPVGWQRKGSEIDDEYTEKPQPKGTTVAEEQSSAQNKRIRWQLPKLPPGFEGWDTSCKPLVQYVTTIWMPSKDFVPLGCHLAGYSPICMHDDLLGNRLVTRAIQVGGFPFYALLAVASSRIKIASPWNQDLTTVPEHFMMKAIRSLRHDIAAKVAPSGDDLVLGLAFISLAAVFSGQHHDTVSMYGAMMRRMIDSMGGLAALSDFTAFFVTITDFLAASVVVTTTSLTFTDDQGSQIASAEPSSLAGNNRFEGAVKAHNTIAEILSALDLLPAEVLCMIRTYVRDNSRQYYKTATSALQLCWIGRRPATEWHNNPRLAQADLLLAQTRYLAVGLWLRSIAIGFAGKALAKDCELFSRDRLKEDACRMLSALKEVKSLLVVTDWKVPRDLSEWMTELYGKLVPSSADNFSYAHAARMERVAKSRCLPLDRVAALA